MSMIAKLLFPKTPRPERDRKARALIIFVLFSLLVVGLVAAGLVWPNYSDRFRH